MRVFVLSRFFPLRLRKPPVFEEDKDALLAAGDNALVADEDALDAAGDNAPDADEDALDAAGEDSLLVADEDAFVAAKRVFADCMCFNCM